MLNIVVDETRIFSTKERAPFYICLEVFDPIECCKSIHKERYYSKLARPITLKVLPQPLSGTRPRIRCCNVNLPGRDPESTH